MTDQPTPDLTDPAVRAKQLAICEAASPGPWIADCYSVGDPDWFLKQPVAENRIIASHHGGCDFGDPHHPKDDYCFIATTRDPDIGYEAALKLIGDQQRTIEALVGVLHEAFVEHSMDPNGLFPEHEPDWIPYARARLDEGKGQADETKKGGG